MRCEKAQPFLGVLGRWRGSRFSSEPAKVQEENPDERMAEPISREVVLQIPHSDRTEVSEESNLWSVEEADWRCAERSMSAIWCGVGGGSCDAR